MTDLLNNSQDFLVFERSTEDQLHVAVVHKQQTPWIMFRVCVKNSERIWNPINSMSLQIHEILEVARTLQAQTKQAEGKRRRMLPTPS